MKKLLRNIFGIAIILAGGGLLVLCGYLFFTSTETQWVALLTVAFFGLMLVLSGWSIFAGEKISDVLRYIFTGYP